jgi:ABC-2 type transport system permease protein
VSVIGQTLATARRVMSQLRHDPRTIALVLVVPWVLMVILRLVYEHHLRVFNQAGAPLLAVFPLATMFVVSSVAVLRERTNGTLERLLTTPLNRLALLGGYAIAFALLATIQAISVAALALGPLDLHVAGPTAMVLVLCVAIAVLGMGLGLLASAFANTEFQVVQFFPATMYPQLLLAGLLVPRQRMIGVLHAISDAMPLSYAVDAMHHLSREHAVAPALWGDLAIVIAFAVASVAVGAVTLRRRTA